jgi:hypothetical protein
MVGLHNILITICGWILVKIEYLTDFDYVETLLSSLNENSYIIFSHKLNLSPTIKRLHFWKTIGLLITDGQFSLTLRKNRAILAFVCLALDTAIAVAKTLLQLSNEITIKVGVKRRKVEQTLCYYVRVMLRESPRNIYDIRKEMYLYIKRLLQDPVSVLSGLNEDELSALFSGIIDGDGHIGKSYIAVSYEIKTLKGQLIHRILNYLRDKGYIKAGEYTPKKRERFFTATNYSFLKKCQRLVYHPLRRRRLKSYLLNYSKNYVCGFSIEELKQLLSIANSAYIDLRKPPRTSKVLVLYIKKKDFAKVKHTWFNEMYKPKPIVNDKRIMIKLTTKCSEELFKIMQDKEAQQMIKPKIISRIQEYLANIKMKKV